MVIHEISECPAVSVVASRKPDFRGEPDREIDTQARVEANSTFPGFLLSISRVPKANAMLTMEPNLS